MGDNKRRREVDVPDGNTLKLLDRALADIQPRGKQPGEFTVSDLCKVGDGNTDPTTLRSRANKMVRAGKWLRRNDGSSVFFRYAE